MTAALEARDLHKTYPGDGAPVHALRGVDLVVGAGEFVAVMGPSGCGKSTLLHLLGALDTPTTGDVLLGGRPLSQLSDRELTLARRHRIGFVFQFFNLVPVLTVEENVALPSVIDAVRPSAYRPVVDGLLDLVGVSNHRVKVPSQLSGGEQQRVAIARALVNRPAVLLADEPTGSLDSATGDGVMGVFRRLHEGGQTIVLVTHADRIASRAQRVLFMRDGKLVEEASPADLPHR